MDGDYEALVDGAAFFVALSGPAYLTAVPAGDHVVSLVAPTNCSVETDPQSVTVTEAALIRDTVEVTFSVTCVPRSGTLRITAPTTGSIPAARYSVWICSAWQYYCCLRHLEQLLGELEPNGTLVASPEPGRYQLDLRDVPARCSVHTAQPECDRSQPWCTTRRRVPGQMLALRREAPMRCTGARLAAALALAGCGGDD